MLNFRPSVGIGLAVLVIVALAGCQQPPPPVVIAPPRTAESTFKDMLASVKSRLEDDQGSNVVVFGSGSRTSFRYDVSGRFIAPKNPSENPRGVMHVDFSTYYVAGTGPTETVEVEVEPPRSPLDLDIELPEGVDPELFADLPSVPQPQPSRFLVDTTQRSQETKNAKDYEFRWVEDHWELMTEFAPEGESAVEFAVKEALTSQW